MTDPKSMAVSDCRHQTECSKAGKCRASIPENCRAGSTGNVPCGDVLAVKIERGRVWIERGVQSFMLAYEGDDEEDLNWYAERLREALNERNPNAR